VKQQKKAMNSTSFDSFLCDEDEDDEQNFTLIDSQSKFVLF